MGTDYEIFGSEEVAVEVSEVTKAYAGYVKSLPPPLPQLGEEVIRRLSLAPSAFPLAIPFWLGELFNLPRNDCRLAAFGGCLATTLAFLYDGIMDTGSREWSQLLPVGIALRTEVERHYRELFPVDSPFWRCADSYMMEWAQSVAWDSSLHWNRIVDFKEGDLVMVGRKSALAKLPAAAAAVLAKRGDLIDVLDRYTDQMMTAGDLGDQLRDLEDDLTEQHYGYVLTRAVVLAGWESENPPSASFVRRALVFTDAISDAAETAFRLTHHARESALRVGGGLLASSADFLNMHCAQLKAAVAEGKAGILKRLTETAE
jgi:hypothetical protein